LRLTTGQTLHAGFGTGTQLALAVAAAVLGVEASQASRLGELTGRGARSAIGVHGFAQGGWLVDGGKQQADGLGCLVARVDFPELWPILLWIPHDTPGLCGEAERDAFRTLEGTPPAVTDRLASLVLRGLLPAIIEHDYDSFSAALAEYGEAVGQQFRTLQGGVLRSPSARTVASWLAARGVHAVAQTSWGPTIAAVLPNEASVRALLSEWPCTDGRLLVTHAMNHGAIVRQAPA
jgi:beta-RFAP synthase